MARRRADPTALWTRSAADRQAVAAGCTFDLDAAERVKDFFSQFLRHSKGEFAGQPFTLLDWQWSAIIAPLFGWKRPDGTRRYRRAYIEVPKKNGKSTLCAGISLYLLLADGEPGAEVYSAAADREQASIVFREAASMVRASPVLESRLQVVDSVKRIVHQKTASWYKALSADVPTKEGLNIHGLIFDELHAQKTRDLYETLTYGGASRRQPLFLSITTAGYDRESICYEQHVYARGILEGRVEDPWFFPFIAGADKEDDWKSPAVWRKANPSFGATVKADQFETDCKEAQESPAKENAFRRYRLNQWTDAATRWIASERWDACDLPPHGIDRDPCYIGIDLSSKLDTSSMVALFCHEDDTYGVHCYCWIPDTAAKERERKNRQRFDEWIRRGFATRIEGDVIRNETIRAKVKELADTYNVREIAFDPWSATELAQQLQDEDGLPVVAFRQGYASMSEPAKKLEELILGRKIRHGGNPVLRWMIGNCCVEIDPAGNIKPSKKASTEKIDLVVSLCMALGRAMLLTDVKPGMGLL